MKNKQYSFLFFLLSAAMYSQTSAKPNFIKKDIKVNNAFDIVNRPNHKSPVRGATPEIANAPVYYDNKFYTQEIITKIHPDSISSIEFINIPDNLSKDLRTIIYIRKK